MLANSTRYGYMLNILRTIYSRSSALGLNLKMEVQVKYDSTLATIWLEATVKNT